MIVSIQGRPASFHEIAAKAYYHLPISLIYRDSFEEVFDDVASGCADRAFVATQNSAHGVITETKQLKALGTTKIEGEYQLPITQHLIGLPSATVSDITEVISHPVALSQCARFLSQHSSITQTTYHDTAAAVEFVAKNVNPHLVAIGSEAAAALYGLKIIEAAVQDDKDNTTTFQSLSAIAGTTSATSDNSLAVGHTPLT